MLSTGKLPFGGLSRNSVDRITDCPNMTSAVYLGCKAINQTNKQPKLPRRLAQEQCGYVTDLRDMATIKVYV